MDSPTGWLVLLDLIGKETVPVCVVGDRSIADGIANQIGSAVVTNRYQTGGIRKARVLPVTVTMEPPRDADEFTENVNRAIAVAGTIPDR